MCCLMISEILWHSHEGNFTGNALDIYPWYEFENHLFNITAISPRDQWVDIKILCEHVLKLNEVAPNKTILSKLTAVYTNVTNSVYQKNPTIPSTNLPLTSQFLTDGGTFTDGTDRHPYIQLQQNNNETRLILHMNTWWNPRPELCGWHECHVNALTSWILVMWDNDGYYR